MSIDDVLRMYDLEPRLVLADVSENNPWYELMEKELSVLCENVLPVKVRFAFNKCRSVQAYVIYHENLVVMTAGMFNVLCHVACRVVTSGAFAEFEGGVEKTWVPNSDFHLGSVASAFSKIDFNWANESELWQKAGERQILFFYILQTLSKFVVLHEIGHIHHNHGARFLKCGTSNMDVDLVQYDLLTREEGVASQTREILADNFAFSNLQKLLKFDIRARVGVGLIELIAQKLLQAEDDKVKFSLTVVYLYFHMMDRHDWHSFDAFRLTHPPAPFRLKNLFAITFENRVSDLQEEEFGRMLKDQYRKCNALVSQVYNTYPVVDFFEKVDEPRFNELQRTLYEEHIKWLNVD